jgi:hypothetical protein
MHGFSATNSLGQAYDGVDQVVTSQSRLLSNPVPSKRFALLLSRLERGSGGEKYLSNSTFAQGELFV